uniref:UPF0029 domain-containing protein n=1 Tax=Macrostomum lignano TaxID=282301 RepID=A0A1I8FBE1_9PLAT
TPKVLHQVSQPQQSRQRCHQTLPQRGKLQNFVHGEPIEGPTQRIQATCWPQFIASSSLATHGAVALPAEKKIASATHNIWAYRIVRQSVSFTHDCDDDGEQQAGGRLLRLLELSDTRNALVVVSPLVLAHLCWARTGSSILTMRLGTCWNSEALLKRVVLSGIRIDGFFPCLLEILTKIMFSGASLYFLIDN